MIGSWTRSNPLSYLPVHFQGHMLTSLGQAHKSVKDNSPDVPGQTWKCLSGPKLVRKTILKDGRHDACSPQIVSKSMHWSVYSCRFLVFCSCGRRYPDDAGPWKGPRASRGVPCLASHSRRTARRRRGSPSFRRSADAFADWRSASFRLETFTDVLADWSTPTQRCLSSLGCGPGLYWWRRVSRNLWPTDSLLP